MNIEKKSCKHQWKKLKADSIILLDTEKKEAAKYYKSKCTQCGEISEIIDKRTRAQVTKKYILKANQKYLIGNNGKFAQYLVPEDSIFVIKEKV